MPAVLRIPGTTITGVPAPAPAQVLPASSTPGVVALFEPGHPLSGKSGVPASGEFFNDVAEAWVTATLSGAPSNGFLVTNTIPTTSPWAFAERTGKGGLHVASAQAGAGTPYQNFTVGLGNARRAYLDERVAAGDFIYVSVWDRETRPAKSTYATGVPVASVRRAFNLGDYYAAAGSAAGQPWVWPQSGARHAGSRTEKTVTAMFSSVAAGGALSGSFATANNFVILGARDAGTLNNMPSKIVYRVYIENLTASGRSFAQVDALDRAEYGDQVLTPGGRYYGDTWTSPTASLA